MGRGRRSTRDQDAEPDGEWNSHLAGNVLERPHWQWEAGDLDEEKPITLVQADGTMRVLPEEDAEVANAIGELLKAVLVKARVGRDIREDAEDTRLRAGR